MSSKDLPVRALVADAIRRIFDIVRPLSGAGLS
jgi:hypothetical protein